MIKNWQIQVRPEGNKFLASVLRQTSFDQREGASYETIGVALGETEEDAVYDAVREAFFP